MLSRWIGKLLNLAGFPGFIREVEYRTGESFGKKWIRVSVDDLYTKISIDGLDIYFNRVSGTIDGVGGNPIRLGIADELKIEK